MLSGRHIAKSYLVYVVKFFDVVVVVVVVEAVVVFIVAKVAVIVCSPFASKVASA
jgi:hypothetical protein